MAKRKMPKRQKVQPKLYIESDLAAAARKGCESSARYNIYLTCGSFLLVLHELHGFGYKRLNAIIDKAMSIEFDKLSVTELLDEVYVKTGIDLKELEAHRNDL